MRILIIRPGAIGDNLLALPLVHALSSHYADARITFVGNAAVLPLVRASGLAGEVSDFLDPSWSALFSDAGISDRISGYDLALCWLRDPDAIVERNLHSAGITQVIVAPGRPPEGERVHIVDYLSSTINRGLNGQPIVPDPRFTLPLPLQPEIDQRRIVIHPGSGGANKCWPPASFAALIQLVRERGYSVTLLCGPADHERIAAMINERDEEDRNDLRPYRPDIVMDAPLMEVARHIQQGRSYLGNDSGITHLAAMLGTPVVALFGPSDPAVWHPIGPSVTVIHEPRMEEITVDQVVEAVVASAA